MKKKNNKKEKEEKRKIGGSLALLSIGKTD